jgi:hypothetical protein
VTLVILAILELLELPELLVTPVLAKLVILETLV